MSNQSANNKRIANNTIYLYIRMLLVMGVSLYTSRLTLDVLGVDDYGLYIVVGGVVSMLGFLNSSMAISVQRFLSFEMGKDNPENVQSIFSTSLFVHVFLAIIVVFLLETIGVWFVSHKLLIPDGREDAAMWVFQCVVITTALSIVMVPYSAMIMAKEKMDIYAYVSIIDVVLKLLVLFLLLNISYDKLVIYAILLALQGVAMILINAGYCLWKFKEARFTFTWNKKNFKGLVFFAGWSLLGELAWTFTGQGVGIILNQFFGPAVVAARGLAEQVNMAVSRFVQGFQTAANPQLIKLYASGEIGQMTLLLFRVTRFSFYILLFLSLPLILEMEYVLNLWLAEVPPHTVYFCQLILINSLTMALSNPLSQVARAYGKIRQYQMWVSFALLLNFPISYVALCIGLPPESVMTVYLGISVLLILVRLIICKPMIDLSIRKYAKDIIFRVTLVSGLSAILPAVIVSFIEPSFSRLVLTVVLSVLSISTFSFVCGMPTEDKIVVKGIINRILNRGNKYI